MTQPPYGGSPYPGDGAQGPYQGAPQPGPYPGGPGPTPQYGAPGGYLGTGPQSGAPQTPTYGIHGWQGGQVGPGGPGDPQQPYGPAPYYGSGGPGGPGGQGPKRGKTTWWIAGIAAVVVLALAVAGIVFFINRDGDGETTSAAPAPSDVAAGSSRTVDVPSGSERSSAAAASPTSVVPVPDIDDSFEVPDLADVKAPAGAAYVIRIEGTDMTLGSWSDNVGDGAYKDLGAQALPWTQEGKLPAPQAQGFGGMLSVIASGTDLKCTVEIDGKVVEESTGSFVTCNVTWSPE